MEQGVLLFTLLFELTSVVVVMLEAPCISGAVVCAVAKRGDVSTTSYILTPCGLVCKPMTLFIIESPIFQYTPGYTLADAEIFLTNRL